MPADPVETLAHVVAALGGSHRPSQELMVRGVAAAIGGAEARDQEAESGDDAGPARVLMVQAGTGTGKSLGYLVPAVAAVQEGARVVVATATLALQRQLVTRDLPAILAAVPGGDRVSFDVLKGRGNYLCRARLAGDRHEDAEELDLGLGSGGRLELQAVAVRAWAEETASGDRDDVPDDVDDRVWRSLSATGRECVGPSRCAFATECFSEVARARAGVADIVVTNHALLAIDALDETPVVPEHDVLVVDEAHELAGRATTAGTAQLSARDAARALQRARRLVPDDELAVLAEAVAGLERALAGVTGTLRPVPAQYVEPLAALRDACHRAVTALPRDDAVSAADRHRVAAALEDVHDIAGRVLTAGDHDVVWLAGHPRPALYVAPLSVAGPLGGYLRRRRAAVLTSATLTIGGDFTALSRDLGLEPGEWSGLDAGSPFNYPEQGILYVAADLPPPGREAPGEAAVGRVRELIAAAGGRTMVLLSSWRAVERVAADLVGTPLPGSPTIHVQRRGEPVARLVDAFAADENSVLVGTMSLFQGVDVPGRSCVCVIVDRIPFPRPDDPVLSARAERVVAAGGNGFMAISVPRAALLLAQGAGRLIRSGDDRGVVAVLDSRLATARYAGYLRRSLPPFWTTTDTGLVVAALGRLAEGSGGLPAGVTAAGTR